MPIPKVTELVHAYNLLLKDWILRPSLDADYTYDSDLFTMAIAKIIIEIAWHNIGGKMSRLSFEKVSIAVPIRKQYIDRIKDPKIRAYILANIKDYTYKFKTDIHVNIDGRLAVGVECKAYTENAMMKRIAVDSMFLKQAHPKALNVLFQLESQLGGDYGDIKKNTHYGSGPTHTILSYFDDVDLNIITLLDGERKVDSPIHKKEFYKPLETISVKSAARIFEDLLASSL